MYLVLKIFLVNAFLLFVIFRVGILFSKFMKNKTLSSIISCGFVFHFAFFEILSIPFLYFHLSFSVIFVIYFVIVFLIIILSYIINAHKSLNFVKRFFDDFSAHKLIFIITTISISIQVFLSIYLFHSDADDSFYVSLINSSMNNPHLYSCDPSTGNKLFPLMSQYIFEGWELFESIISKAFHIQPAVFAHTVIPCFLIICTYFVYYYFAENLELKNKEIIFLFFMSVINIMGGYSDYSSSFFLLGRVWQGKSVVVNIIIPLIYIFFKKYIYSDSKKKYVIMLILISMVGIGYNPIIIYLMPLVIFSLYVSTLYRYKNKDFNYIIKDILNFIIIFIPLFMLAILIKLNISKSYVFDNPDNSLKNFSSIAIFKDFFADRRFLIVYLICTIYVLIYGIKTMKIISFWSQIVLMFFVYNPVFAPKVAQYLTSFPTYWRVFWLIPITYTMSYTFTDIFKDNYIEKSKKYKSLIGIMLLFIIILSGKFVYSKSYSFKSPENAYKIPQEIVQITNYINKQNKKIVVIAPEEMNTTMRQISSSIVLFRSRDSYIQDFLMSKGEKDAYEERERLYSIVLNGNLNDKNLNSLVNKYKINIIIVNKNDVKNKNNLFNKMFNLIKETNNYYIYSVL